MLFSKCTGCNSENSRFIKEQQPIRLYKYRNIEILNPIQDGGILHPPFHPLNSFSTVSSTNVQVRPKIFLNFSFNPFDVLV